MQILRRVLYSHGKIVNDKKENDIEYLKDCVNYLNNLKSGYFEKSSIITTELNIFALMKLLGIYLKMMMKIIVITTLIINNINHFQVKYYCHLINT